MSTKEIFTQLSLGENLEALETIPDKSRPSTKMSVITRTVSIVLFCTKKKKQKKNNVLNS